MAPALCAAEAGINRWEAILIAAAISAGIALLGIGQGARTARQDRQRRLYGEALAAVMEYREYPYIVRRRASESERSDISRSLSSIQGSLNRYIAILTIESRAVGEAYKRLVEHTRAVAGPLIAEGWDRQPRTETSDMRVSDVDLSELHTPTEAFIQTVERHLRILPSFRRSLRLAAPLGAPGTLTRSASDQRRPKAGPAHPEASGSLRPNSNGDPSAPHAPLLYPPAS